jgi:hypothetical protein
MSIELTWLRKLPSSTTSPSRFTMQYRLILSPKSIPIVSVGIGLAVLLSFFMAGFSSAPLECVPQLIAV